MKKIKTLVFKAGIILGLATAGIWYLVNQSPGLVASSHREAPLIANDPLADNTDLYAFRSPDDTNTVTIIAAYIPAELPQGGPNYYSFGEGVRYEIHVKNDATTTGDDITYRFTFKQTNQDPTTFFNIRLGQQNLKTTYKCEKSVNGGNFSTVVTNGVVPPNNIGPRSISDPVVGLNTTYSALMQNAVETTCHNEKVFCGPADDPFFVDLGGIFDLGQARAGGSGVNAPKDGLHCKNVHVIALKIPIKNLQKAGKTVSMAANILDPDFVIGVWASASRQKVTVLSSTGGKPTASGAWVQVSRLGMPLTNEVIIPIGMKDYWNSIKPYNEPMVFEQYFTNPELGLYMDNSLFGGAVPGLSKLRIQRNSLQGFDFGNTHNGLAGLLGNPATNGTALSTAAFGNYLLRTGQPRSVDLLPIFMTGVPNLPPYQLATGKSGNPLAAGKPFINNFLPTFGDMLRLNMAVPITPRNHPLFSSEGIVSAAVLGLTNPTYANPGLQWIPNMDGFPNGRRLEDDVTRIELQAVSGVALAAIGLWYDDYTAGGPNPVTTQLGNVLGFTTGIEQNDKPFVAAFPYVGEPWSGYGLCAGGSFYRNGNPSNLGLNIAPPNVGIMDAFPNPATSQTTFKYHVSSETNISVTVFDIQGSVINTPVDAIKKAGTYEVPYSVQQLKPGIYIASIAENGTPVQTIKFVVQK